MKEEEAKERIIDNYQNPKNYGKIKTKNTIKEKNPNCGDEITIYAKIKDNKIKEIKFEGKGCAISIATASILTEHAKNKDINEIKKWDSKTITKLLGVELGPVRMKCALLPLKTIQKAIGKI